MGESSLKMENTLGKEKLEVSPVPTGFISDLYCKHVKTQVSVGKG